MRSITITNTCTVHVLLKYYYGIYMVHVLIQYMYHPSLMHSVWEGYCSRHGS